MQCHLVRVAPGPRGAAAVLDDADERALETAVQRAATLSLPLPPDRLSTATWRSPDGAVRVWSWSNEEDGPALRRVGPGVVLASGYAHRPLLDVAGDVARVDETGPEHRADDVLDRAGGIWALAHADLDGVRAVSSHAGIEAWFATDADDGSRWLCTRPLLAHLAATVRARPQLDPLGLAGIVNAGHCLGTRTPYAGTQQVGRGTWWTAWAGCRDADPVAVSTRRRPLPARGSEDRVGPALARALVAAAAELPETGTITSGLTGGRDSRIVVAALVAGGHDVVASTKGWEGHHDVVVAERVAAVLGIPHSRTEPATSTRQRPDEIKADPGLLLWRSAVLCDGLVGGYDATGGAGLVHRSDRYGLSGSGGEIHRGGHADLVLSPGDPKLSGQQRAERWLRRDHLLPMAGLLRPEVRTAHELAARGWVEDLRTRGAPAMADYFDEHRVAQWYTGARLGTSLSVTARTPFLDDAAILATRPASVEELHSERPMRDALAEIDPRLLDVPFVGARLAGGGPPPVRPTRSGAASFAWKTDYGEELAAVLRARMDACPVLVEGAGERHLPPGQDWTRAQARRAWHAASAGTLALETFTSPRWRATPARRPVSVRRVEQPEPVPAGGRRPLVRVIDRAGLGRPARSVRRAWRRRGG